MALKLLQQLPKQLRQMGICRYASSCPHPRLFFSQKSENLCVACLCISSARCIQSYGYRKLKLDQTKRLTTIVREPSLVGSSSSVGLHKDSFPRVYLAQMHHPTTEDQENFYMRLRKCTSSHQVFRLLRSVKTMTDSMAAASLHHVADLEQGVNCLKDPSVLENNMIRALCMQLEIDSSRLTDGGLISALLACTRLYLDPWSTLMLCLVSESQERLNQCHLSVEQLCDLGEALLAMEGHGSVMLEQVMSQIQKQDVARWTVAELRAVYKLLQLGAGFDGNYCDLMNAMHTHAVTVTSSMNPATVSELFCVLTSLNLTQAMPLVISLCKQAVQHVPHFTDEELAIVLGALIHFGHSDHYFVDALEKYVPTMTFTSHPETVTKVIQFFGSRNILSPVVFDAVAESFVYRADDYTASQVARQIIPFGKLGYLPPNAGNMFRKVETMLHTRFSQFQPRTLLNLVHSCVLVERFPVNFFPKVFSHNFVQQLQVQGSEMDCVVAQLTQLFMTVKLECTLYKGCQLFPPYRVKSFLTPECSLETPVDTDLYHSVKTGLVDLLGACSYFESRVMTPYCYTLDVEIKLDDENYVLPVVANVEVSKRIALCIDGEERYTSNKRQLLGKEAIKQRHLRLLGYEVVQIPFYEFEKLQNKTSVVEYLRQKIFPHTHRLSRFSDKSQT